MEKEIEKLESEGWIMKGTLPCGGCEQDAEIWESPDGKGQIEYCPNEYLRFNS